MLHRAIFGSIERFMGILIENYKGAFPFWMSPYQVGIVPIKPEHNEYAKKVADALENAGIRVEADYADKNMNEKIKSFKNYKDPYILVIGDREVESGTVSVTVRGVKKQLHDVPYEKFTELAKTLNENRSQELISEM